jgi:hypothetical protein
MFAGIERSRRNRNEGPTMERITRNNMIFHISEVQRQLRDDHVEPDELCRLLDEAMHALSVQVSETKRMHALATEIVHPKQQ